MKQLVQLNCTCSFMKLGRTKSRKLREKKMAFQG